MADDYTDNSSTTGNPGQACHSAGHGHVQAFHDCRQTYLVALTAQGSGSNLSLNGATDYYDSARLVTYPKAGVAKYAVLTASASVDYFFTVSNESQRGTGSYAFQVTEAPVDDYAADASTAGVLAINGKVSGSLDYTGDIDAFKVTLQYGAKYAFQLRGAGGDDSTLPLSQVSLRISGPTRVVRT